MLKIGNVEIPYPNNDGLLLIMEQTDHEFTEEDVRSMLYGPELTKEDALNTLYGPESMEKDVLSILRDPPNVLPRTDYTQILDTQILELLHRICELQGKHFDVLDKALENKRAHEMSLARYSVSGQGDGLNTQKSRSAIEDSIRTIEEAHQSAVRIREARREWVLLEGSEIKMAAEIQTDPTRAALDSYDADAERNLKEMVKKRPVVKPR